MMNEEIHNPDDQSEEINIQDIFFKYISHWKWFVASVLICVLCAYGYLRYSTSVYSVSTAIMIKDDKKGGNGTSEMAIFEGMGLLGGSNNVDNEIEILKSKSLIKQVVNELAIHTSYAAVGTIKSKDLYTDSPIIANVDATVMDSLSAGVVFDVTLQKDSSLLIKGEIRNQQIETKLAKLPAILNTPIGAIVLSKGNARKNNIGIPIRVTINRPIAMARSFLSSLSVAPSSKTTSVILLSINEVNKKRGVDFLNKLVEVYNREAMDDKNKVAHNTSRFIEERIALITVELGSTERELEHYKQREKLTDVEQDAKMFLSENSAYEKKRVEVNTQINLIQYLYDYVNSKENKSSLIPGNVGITDLTLVALIKEYNEQLLERNRLSRTSSETNPTITNLNMTIEAIHESILKSIKSTQNGLLISKRDIENQASLYGSQISKMPTKEREFIEIERQRNIKSELFLMLLKKREETSLSLAVTANSAKIVDEAIASDAPVSPKKQIILLVAFILGLFLPIIIIYIKELLSYKLETLTELEKLSKMPIIGDVSIKESSAGPFITEYENTPVAEAFRILRTNVQFSLGPSDKVILVTSTISGEGKTFITSNLAICLAMLNKRVITIGLDLRKPRLGEQFGLSPKEGMTTYLSGIETDVLSLVKPTKQHKNLFCIPAGPIPPNPSELLERDTLESAISTLKENFDYIIIDTAPAGLVVDTFVLSRVADLSIYVCRANYSHKNNIKFANEVYSKQKLPKLSILLNGLSASHRGYGYGQYGYAVNLDKKKTRKF